MRRMSGLALVVVLVAAFLIAVPAAAAPVDRAGGSGAGGAMLQLLEWLLGTIFGSTRAGVPGDGAASAEAAARERPGFSGPNLTRTASTAYIAQP